MIDTKKILLIGFLLALLFVAAACSPAQPTVEPATDEVPLETEQATLPPAEAPTATFQEEISEEPEGTEQPEDNETDQAASAEEADACVECHTDQAMLIDTADAVEEVESENEGAG